MHYYKFNISDWTLHTSHLTEIEELVYFRLINYYYDTESPIPKETQSVIRRLRLGSHSDIVQSILDEFFTLDGDEYRHKRCDELIDEYHAKAIKNKENGSKGGRPKAKETQSVISGNPNETLTNNYKLKTNNHNRGTRLPIDWQPTKDYIDFCKQERPELDAVKVAEQFKDYWVAKAGSAGVKLDWMATWRNWVRNQKSLTPSVKRDANSWRNDDASILKKAASLGVYTSGKSRFEIMAAIDKKEGRV